MNIYDFKLPAERIKTLETEIKMYENYKKNLTIKEQESVDCFIKHHKKEIEKIKSSTYFDAIYEANKDLLLPSIIEDVCIKQRLPNPSVDISWASISAEKILKEIIRTIF